VSVSGFLLPLEAARSFDFHGCELSSAGSSEFLVFSCASSTVLQIQAIFPPFPFSPLMSQIVHEPEHDLYVLMWILKHSQCDPSAWS